MTKKEVISIGDKIIDGLKESKKKLIEFKKQKNSPLVIMKEGKIVEVPASEL